MALRQFGLRALLEAASGGHRHALPTPATIMLASTAAQACRRRAPPTTPTNWPRMVVIPVMRMLESFLRSWLWRILSGDTAGGGRRQQAEERRWRGPGPAVQAAVAAAASTLAANPRGAAVVGVTAFALVVGLIVEERERRERRERLGHGQGQVY